MSNLVIVESPAKANTIKGYLGSGYKVIASKGHIRDLPKSSLGVDIEHGFEPHYINIRGKGDIIKELKKEAKNASKIFLATDPDREGEAISWHLASQLGIPHEKKCRVTFNEITKGAIKEAIKAPREMNEDLVNSQQARRILDRIVGYKLSPFLWKNVKSGLSAGRVQSVATRIITEREEEIRAFVPQEYWNIEATLVTSSGDVLETKFYGDKNGKIKISSEDEAKKIENAVKQGSFRVSMLKHTEKQKNPAPPFTTSTLQQEASKKLGFQSQRIMKVAQELYEGVNLGAEYGGVQGLITYMRTDSLRISTVAQEAALGLIREEYGDEFAPTSPRVYKSKANAQDAHEAIRPSDVRIHPKMIRKTLSSDQYRLYKLIWERFVASQMASAVYDTVSIVFENSGYTFRTAGYTVKFRGYTALYDDPDDNDADDEAASLSHIPSLREGEMLSAKNIEGSRHFTEPPARYNEATLIKFLEDNGIGRPSTYTPIITTIIARGYVKREGKSLVPTPLGEVTTRLMKKSFPEIVDYEFTASMENKLDSIERGETTAESVLSEFYKDFSAALDNAMNTVEKQNIEVPAEESDVICEKCGAKMVYKNGKYGRFLACPNYPECKNTKDIDKDGKVTASEEKEPEKAGFKCPQCGSDMLIRHGRYGDFYACSNYPECKYTKQKVTELDVPCPKCGAKIVARHGRGKTLFYSCERYPECDFSSWDMPLPEKCPLCGEMLYYRKSRKSVICKNKKCSYKREEEREVIE